MLPETHETIEFDEQGKCNICRQHEFKKTKINNHLDVIRDLCFN